MAHPNGENCPVDDRPAPTMSEGRLVSERTLVELESREQTPKQSPNEEKRASILFGEVYAQLKTMAHRELNRGVRNTLDTTALVHELFLKMCSDRELTFEAQPQFFVYAAQAVRHILVDHARRRLTLKLGGEQLRMSLTDPGVDSAAVCSQHALQLNEALDALQATDPRAARVVELHYFAGLPLHKVAEILGVVRRTVDRDWRYARSFLLAHIG